MAIWMRDGGGRRREGGREGGKEGGREGGREGGLLPPGMAGVQVPASFALFNLGRGREPAQDLAHETLATVIQISLRERGREGGREGGRSKMHTVVIIFCFFREHNAPYSLPPSLPSLPRYQ